MNAHTTVMTRLRLAKEVFGEDEHAVDSEAAKWELSAVLWLAVALDVRQADYTWLST
jgi:hypothetical protein